MLTKTDNTKSLDFLQKFYPNDLWCLTAIHPETRKIETKAFDNKFDCDDWLKKHNGLSNLYFQVNPPINKVDKKSSRADIKEVNYLHVDIDPPEYLDIREAQNNIITSLTDARPESIPKPTFIIFSGGGFQAFWKLKEPMVINGDLDLAEDAKRYNQTLEALLSGDNCHNIDRIMRLPGTLNIPDKKKRAKGREPALAKVIIANPDRVYDISEFTPLTPAAPILKSEFYKGKELVNLEIVDKVRKVELKELDEWKVADRIKVIIMQGEHPDQPKDGDNSRSAWLFDVVCELVRKEVSDETIYSIITDSEYLISSSVLERTDSSNYAIKQIQSAKEKVVPELELKDFITNDNGQIIKCPENIIIALQKLGAHLSYNKFSNKIIVAGVKGFGPDLTDAVVNRLHILTQKKFKFKPSDSDFQKIVQDEALYNSFHPVIDYLDSLEWDGKERLGGLFINYFGAEDTELNRCISGITLVAAVRRIKKPGCKFDEMVIIEGEQGIGKSTALKTLVYNPEWFSDDLPLNADTQRQVESLEGNWIVEAGELHGMGKAEVGKLKSFLSRTTDQVRMAYGKLPELRHRQCIIIGTTNSRQYLIDTTGNRRFWPIEAKEISLKALEKDRDQLWAEAVYYEAQGAPTRLSESLYTKAAEEQNARRVVDPYVGLLSEKLGSMTGKIKTVDVYKLLQIPPSQNNTYQNTRVGQAMKELGWTRDRLRFSGDHYSCFIKGTKHEKLKEITVNSSGEILKSSPF